MTARRQNPPAKWAAQGSLAGLAAAMVLTLGGPVKAETQMPFVAHRAIYDLELDADPSRPMVDSARGRIVFEFSGSACEGYTQNFRQVASLQGSEFGERLVDSRASSFEDADGKTMRYSGSVKVNDGEAEEIDGMAEQKAEGITVVLTKPTAETVTLAGSAVFPTAHYRQLVAAALRGNSVLETKVFDGTGDGKTISDTFAIIGKPLPEAKAGDAVRKAGFAALKRWPVTISYFDGEGQEREMPSYSMSMELLENGIADALILNYSDFILKGTLRQIETMPQQACP